MSMTGMAVSSSGLRLGRTPCVQDLAAGGIDIGAAGFFDFDDISTPVGELAHGGRAGAVRGEVEDCEVGQGQGGHGVSSVLVSGP